MSDILPIPSSDLTAEFDRLCDDCGRFDLTDHALVAIRGEDRKGWLQGQVTRDLRHFNPGASANFCICQPTGHLVSICDAWALDDQVLATVPKPTIEAVLHRIEQMTVLEDVVGEDVTKTYRVVSIQGPKATAKLAEILTLPNLDAGTAELEGATVFVLRSNRTGMGGWDVWVPAIRRKALARLHDAFTPLSRDTFDVARLEAGIPKWGADATVKTLPPELGSAFSGKYVSLNKGCYTGQEVLQRLASRGHTNRTWVGLTADRPLTVGDEVVNNRSRAVVGHVSSAAHSPDYGSIGAATVRNDTAFEGETVTIRTATGDLTAEVRMMPLLRFE